jgi:Uma2 family endonuclease
MGRGEGATLSPELVERLSVEGPVTQVRLTSADLEAFPDNDGKRYEIIDGELYVSKQPSWEHQLICVGLTAALDRWDMETGAGVVNAAPGIIFAEHDDVAPDLVWVSSERLPLILAEDRKLHAAPELIIEVLSPGSANEKRDRQAKLDLYSRRGVMEYWIVDWQRRQIEIYRRQRAALRLVHTLVEVDSIQTPLLPGFNCPLRDLFARLP